jgi:flagellar hook protein FlgE
MFTSFSTALSALNACATAVDVTANNLANLNTPGFKTSVVYFRDLVTQSLGAGLGETQVGFGTGQPLTIRQFSQGAVQSSTGLLDAAIQGDGFFVLRSAQSGQLFTRAGNFQVDKAGNLLTNTGESVQGWTTVDPTTNQVNTSGPVMDIVLPVGSVKPPHPTTNFTLDMNLNSSAAADATSKFSTPVTIYDSLGTSHILTVTLQKTGPNEWSYDVSIPGQDVTGGTAGEEYSIPNATGTLTFNSVGRLTSPDSATPITFDITGLVSGAADMTGINWNLYYASGTPRLTQFGQPSAPSANAQNGSPAAQLLRVGLGTGGMILAGYSDGQQVVVAQVAMASIRNPESLIASGNNNLQVSARSASPAIGMPGTGGRGSVLGGAIEYSTVDIAREFTNLIVLQRDYQANARVVTAVDELSQETINLKRP